MSRLWVSSEPNSPPDLGLKQTADTQADDSDISHLIHCCICFDVFEEPKALNCLHRFCEKCIHGYILGSQDQPTGLFKERGFKCPMCRAFIKAPDAKKPPVMWAALLKTDFHLKNLIRIVRSNRFPILSNSEDDKTTCGKVHTERQRTRYCADCQAVICPTCAQKHHSECTMILPLQEAAADQRARATMWLSEISPALEKASRLEEVRETRQEELAQKKTAIRQVIIRQADEIRQLVQKEENRLLEKLDQEVDAQQSRIALEGIMFNDKLASYKEQFKTVHESLKVDSDLELMGNAAFTKSANGAEEINFVEYENFINSLSSLNITFHQAKLPAVSLGTVAVTCRRQLDCQFSYV